MNTQITGRHMEMTDSLKAYIQGGLDKIEAHFDKVMRADVVLDIQKHRHIAEVNLHANGVRIHGRESSADMYASVDAVMEKLDRQVRKFKDRINRHQPRSMREERQFHHAIVSPEPENGTGQQQNEEKQHKVVKREKLTMRPMSIPEAMMQLELIDDHPFLVFSNADTAQVNVLYSLENGTYGLIEPQF